VRTKSLVRDRPRAMATCMERYEGNITVGVSCRRASSKGVYTDAEPVMVSFLTSSCLGIEEEMLERVAMWMKTGKTASNHRSSRQKLLNVIRIAVLDTKEWTGMWFVSSPKSHRAQGNGISRGDGVS
jgi:hypothetical protein